MPTTIGLDIGSSAVRAAQVSTQRGATTLERIGQVLLPAGAVHEGEIRDVDAVADCIRTLWTEHKFKGRKVALGVANQQVVVRQMDVPYLPEDQLRESLPYQVADVIPIPVEQAVLDFHVLEQFENEDGQPFTRIMLVAAQREMIDQLVAVTRKAKLEPVLVDLDAFSVLRCLAPPKVLDEPGGELLIDVGHSVTNLVVHENGEPRFVRMLMMGGGAISTALMNVMGMSAEEAERAKAVHGVGKDAADETARIIAERAEVLIDEIRGSIDYYTAQADAVPLRRMVVTGGSSRLPGLVDRLAETLQLEVQSGQPLRQLHVGKVNVERDDLVEAQAFLSVAVGLAMGVAE